MIISRFHFCDSLFENETILDGEMIKDNQGSWIFLIHDLLVHKSQSMSNISILQRNQLLHEMLTARFYEDMDDVCMFQVKKLFKITEMATMLDVFMPSLPYTCRGIYFKPYFFKFKDIYYNFDDSNIKSVVREKYTRTFNTIGDVERKLQKKKVADADSGAGASPAGKRENKDGEKRKFMVEKTSVQDVYNLYDVESGAFVDNACLPTMRASKLLQSAFGNATLVVRIPIIAEYSSRFQKWIPSSLAPQ
jgi:hypothetical protein